MKTFVIVSDSHRNRAALDKLDGVFSECDYIVHLGDLSSDGGYIRRKYPYQTIVINGNCDLDKLGDDEKMLGIEGVKIFMCNGHRYSVKLTLARLAEEAEKNGCTVALYGHTHEAEVREENGVLLINPGCMTAYAPHKSYCYLVVNGKKAVPTIVNL